MNLPKPSSEQYNIINSLITDNIVVNAVAGSGKTTLALLIASAFPRKNILLITYNRKLKEETREKIKTLWIHNLEAH
jgi:DNA helicase IV